MNGNIPTIAPPEVVGFGSEEDIKKGEKCWLVEYLHIQQDIQCSCLLTNIYLWHLMSTALNGEQWFNLPQTQVPRASHLPLLLHLSSQMSEAVKSEHVTSNPWTYLRAAGCKQRLLCSNFHKHRWSIFLLLEISVQRMDWASNKFSVHSYQMWVARHIECKILDFLDNSVVELWIAF